VADTHADQRRNASRGRGGASPGPQLRTDAEVTSASQQINLAVALCGLTAGERLTCPWCGTSKKGTVRIIADKFYLKCHKCGEWRGAVKLVQEILGVSFPVAVDLLNGKDPQGSSEDDEHRAKRLAEMAERAAALAKNSFRAEMTAETVAVYNAVLASKHVSLEAAQRYYATWHISAEAVATVGFVYIVSPDELAAELLERFGRETVVKSGIAKELDEKDKDRDRSKTGLRFMFSASYPVVEPQIGPAGNCMSMQFRPSLAQKAKIDAHKRGEAPYVPAFMSLRGAGPEHLIGIGLDYLITLPPTRVDVVEGAKDVAADLTLGNKAFGMPGTGVLPPAKVIKALARAGHTIRICMDGDEAGRAAQQKVLEHFLAAGYPEDMIFVHPMPDGLDVTDILVRREANRGCQCPTCSAFRGKQANGQ